MNIETIISEVRDERYAQIGEWGDQSDLPDGTGVDSDHGVDLRFTASRAEAEARHRCKARAEEGTVTFADILVEEVCEAMASTVKTGLRTELIQVAAVAVQWVEAIDARGAK